MKKVLIVLALVLVLGAVVFFFLLPPWLENRMNAVIDRGPYQPTERAAQLHGRLLIADMHADSLLWNRDLLERGSRGHVDVPRLIEGNVALQAFTVVTKTPRGQNIENNDASTDNITLLAVAERWPPAAWSSLKERALYQAEKLHDFAARSGGKLTIIESAEDLSDYLESRKQDRDMTAGFLGVEGAQALDGDIRNVDVLFNAGFRMMAPTHFFDNDIGGSAHGTEKGGLTDKGREMIKRMESLGMIVDVAHASSRAIDDVLAMATRPVFVSHTGVKGTCDNTRNLSDDHIRGVARTGGVIGVGYWDTATCGTDARAIARAMRYVANLVGARHIGLGSDYDGAVTAPFDTSQLVRITDALRQEGFTDQEIEMIMGGNVLRLLKESLP